MKWWISEIGRNVASRVAGVPEREDAVKQWMSTVVIHIFVQ